MFQVQKSPLYAKLHVMLIYSFFNQLVMKIYQIIITDKLIDFGIDKIYDEKRELNFLSEHLRTAYLQGYLYPFLKSYEQIDGKQVWGWTGTNNFKVEYSFDLKEFEIEFITNIPLKDERQRRFESNQYNKMIESDVPYEDRLKLAVENPLRYENRNCSPTQFDLHFPKLSIY